MNPFLILFIGLFLVLLEFYLPGAVMGTAGALLILGSLFLFVLQNNSPLYIVLFFLFALISVFAVIKFALWYIPRSKKYSIYSKGAQEGYQASAFDTTLIGKEAIVYSDLKPGGYIFIDGKQHQAISESGYIPRGQKVLILRGEGESLIVKSIN